MIATFLNALRSKRASTGKSLPGASARHSEPSVIASLDDQAPKATPFLIQLLAEASILATRIDVTDLKSRCVSEQEQRWMDTWPGEHYKLLPAIARAVEASTAVEIGTYRGQGTLALRLACSRVTTYDIAGYESFQGTVLAPLDFEQGIEQRIGDLSQPDFFEQELPILREADLIFVDGPKDGQFEWNFARLLYPALEGSGTVIVWDDIRLMSMIDFWRWLPASKVDATSLGHWSGTGLTQA